MNVRCAGVVEEIICERPGCQEITARAGEETRSALNYTEITGPVCVGDTVILNCVAVSLGLGTGGYDFVAEAMRPVGVPREETLHAPPPGHILKLRYTPLQFPTLCAEAPENPHHDALRHCETLGGLPVVCAELHSRIPAIAAAAKWASHGRARVAYVMTEGAALPLALSSLVPQMKARGLLDATITAGQAFGGDYEAVNLFSALMTARYVAHADIVLVAQGPGAVGTDTTLGFSGAEQAVALNAVAALEGTALAAARISFADPRPRHQGLSHHTVTVLNRLTLHRVLVPLPRLREPYRTLLQESLDESGVAEKHEIVMIDAEVGYKALEETEIPVTTMSRSIAQERKFHLAAAAAGLLAAQLYEMQAG